MLLRAPSPGAPNHRLRWRARGLGPAGDGRPPGHGPDVPIPVLELSPRWLDHIPTGGASGVMSLRRAARAVQAGDADIVACVSADTNHVDSFRLTLGSFSNFARDASYPYGSGGPNSIATSAITGARNVSPMTPTVPATKEEIAAMPRAGPARPSLARA